MFFVLAFVYIPTNLLFFSNFGAGKTQQKSMYSRLAEKKGSIAVIGLGYVGLPLALELAKNFKVIGFDINRNNISLLNGHTDPSRELGPEAFEGSDIIFTDNHQIYKKSE